MEDMPNKCFSKVTIVCETVMVMKFGKKRNKIKLLNSTNCSLVAVVPKLIEDVTNYYILIVFVCIYVKNML